MIVKGHKTLLRGEPSFHKDKEKSPFVLQHCTTNFNSSPMVVELTFNVTDKEWISPLLNTYPCLQALYVDFSFWTEYSSKISTASPNKSLIFWKADPPNKLNLSLLELFVRSPQKLLPGFSNSFNKYNTNILNLQISAFIRKNKPHNYTCMCVDMCVGMCIHA